jgi:hypothetical protein
VVDVRRQQQAIRAVEPFGIGGITPRLDVASFQMPRFIYPSDPTEFFA